MEMNKQMTVNSGKGNSVAVAGERWLNDQEIEFVKKQFFPPNTANNMDAQYCLEVSKQFNLNPITKQIYFVPRKLFQIP